ncbi:B12 binding domain-containing protein [Desulfatibacillum alkenivorans DSM 16219]|uniref:B12 binding domain-containing protein n=1 Tax=Desulfatibacillum alkenivorans DSM 16219 TaxID=1121393 RepID=A0A1M6BSE2_9BACT|nr:cobalamin-dependent protein [Desulfatibacillum alkenivorans]SHI51659.1 B12 binding domain-containing protein [Desulfatibacillum alkenivorans DSM 16219]
MKIALIIPESGRKDLLGRYSDTMTPFPTIGVAYIAAVLERDKHEVLVIDQFAQKLTARQTISLLRDFRPRMVGISCLTAAMPSVEILSSLIREDLPQAAIVLGNIHAWAFHEYLLNKNIGDFIVHGEGESAMASLAQALECGASPEAVPGLSFPDHGQCVQTGPVEQIADLDDLPYPAWHLLPYHLYE